MYRDKRDGGKYKTRIGFVVDEHFSIVGDLLAGEDPSVKPEDVRYGLRGLFEAFGNQVGGCIYLVGSPIVLPATYAFSFSRLEKVENSTNPSKSSSCV